MRKNWGSYVVEFGKVCGVLVCLSRRSFFVVRWFVDKVVAFPGFVARVLQDFSYSPQSLYKRVGEPLLPIFPNTYNNKQLINLILVINRRLV